MKLFNRLKKDKSNYDVTNIKVTDLDKGFIFEYNLNTWEVVEVYKYDWGDNEFSFEYKISCENDTKFLSIEESDELFIVLSQKANIRKISKDLPELLAAENAPKKILFNNKEFYLDEECPGYFCNLTQNKKKWTEFIAWTYIDDNETEVIEVEQWGEKEFEASVGIVLKSFEITNIIPAKNN